MAVGDRYHRYDQEGVPSASPEMPGQILAFDPIDLRRFGVAARK